MAFTGAAIIQALGRNTVRITGVSLKAGAQGVISLPSGPGDVKLPSTFPSSAEAGFTLSELVEASARLNAQAGPEATPPHIDKSDAPFELIFTNQSANDSGTMEIYVKYLHSGTR